MERELNYFCLQRMETNHCPLFQSDTRKGVSSVYALAKKIIIKLVSNVCDSHLSSHEVHEVRKYLRLHLPSVILTDLLSDMIPTDKWKFPCATSRQILKCGLHSECALGKDYIEIL